MNNEKWIENTARVFYQIFSVDYEDEKFEKKLLIGGGGISIFCSTWTGLSKYFIKYRISKKAYKLLPTLVEESDKNLIRKEENTVILPYKLYKKYHYLWSSNEKGAANRKIKRQYFQRDHNPSNKKVLSLISQKIKNNKDKKDFLKELSKYIQQVQTVDLITVEEDDIRTEADRKSKPEKLDASERDKLIGSEFYDLIITK